MRVRPDQPARIEPDRRWYGNTRTIAPAELDKFREEVKEAAADPYTVLLHHPKLPMALINDPTDRQKRPPILDLEPFAETFGPGSKRKRPRLADSDLNGLMNRLQEKSDNYDPIKDQTIEREDLEAGAIKNRKYEKGQSRRIWEELYKVLDSSDVICQVIDARDPLGTRCPHVEQQLKSQPHKHLVFILNKCDLVPTWVTAAWLKHLSKEHPTLAFRASLTNPFGKNSLMMLLRQFEKFHKDKKNISVGFIGYPNVGKSSIINTLRSRAVCKVAPIPGETKYWQYVTLTKRIYLIDCPGVVYDTGDNEDALVLKGVVRAEKLEDATIHVSALLARVRPDHISSLYGVSDWTDDNSLLEAMARKQGRLLKGGEPDLNTVAKVLIYDWQRGKIPYYAQPPETGDAAVEAELTAALAAPTESS